MHKDKFYYFFSVWQHAKLIKLIGYIVKINWEFFQENFFNIHGMYQLLRRYEDCFAWHSCNDSENN